MKKFLSLLLAFAMILSLVPVTALAAEGDPTITATADKTEASVGDTLEVTFTLANNPGFTNIELMLSFDKNVLQFTGLKTEDGEYVGRFSSGTTVVNSTVNAEKYGSVTNARANTSTANSDLFVAQFTVIGTGSTTVSATVEKFKNITNDGVETVYTPVVTPSAAVAVSGTPATSVTLDKTELSLEEGESYLLEAKVEPTGTTDEVVWESSAPGVATVVNGIVKAVSAGNATITAKANDTAYAECAVTVTAEQSVVGKSAMSYGDWDETAALTGIKSMTLGGETKTIKNIYKLTLEGHEEFYLRAVGIMSVGYKLDGSSYIGDQWGADMSAQGVNYNWAAIHTKDLLVSYADLVAAVGASNASKLGVSEEDTLAFMYVKNPEAYSYGILFKIDAPPEATSISIPETLEVTVGNSSTLNVTIEPSGAEETLTWSSSNVDVATVDGNGKVTGVASGTATITVSNGTLSDTCTVTVATAIANIPSNGDYSGSLNSITIGGVAIEDYSWSGKTLNVFVPASTNTTAKVRFDWVHSYNQGDSKTVDVTITDGVGTYSGFTTYGDWVINFAVRTPATGISLNKETTQIRIGDKETLTATITPENSTDSITWTSADSTIAKVDQNGMVTAVAAGEVDITATAGEKSATCKVTVYTVPATSVTISGEGIENGKVRLLIGQHLVPTITIEPANTTDKVSYAIDDPTVAFAIATGRIIPQKEGKANYTVTVGKVSATLEVEVYGNHAESLTLDKSTLSMNYGDSVTLTATVLPEDHTDGSVTWESSNTSVVTVDNGTVKAVGGGTATVTAKLGSITAECVVTVAEPYKATENLPKLDDPYGYSVKMDYIYIIGAEVESMTWDGLTCNVTLKEGTADGTSVKAIAHASYSWGNKDFSAAGTLTNGAGTVTVNCSDWWMNPTDLVFNFTVADGAEPEPTTYTVNIDENIIGGTVTASAMENIAAGTEITLTAAPDEGYQFVSFDVKKGEETVTVTDGKFQMPEGNVTVSATFTQIPNPIQAVEAKNPLLNKTSAEDATAPVYSVTLMSGVTEDLLLDITGENPDKEATQQLTWSSTKPNVAWVEDGKLITGTVTESTAVTLTATVVSEAAAAAIDGEGSDALITLNVTVEPANNTQFQVSMDTDKTVDVLGSTDVNVSISHTDPAQVFKAFELVFKYDPALLQLNTQGSETDTRKTSIVDDNGTVTVRSYGAANEGAALTLNFTALTIEDASVELTSAKVGTTLDAQSQDIPDAQIQDSITLIDVSAFTVDLDKAFTGAEVADPSEDYTFTANNNNYVYTAKVTVTKADGSTKEFTLDKGVYTIPKEEITGSIKIEVAAKEGKTVTVSFDGDSKAAVNQVTSAQFEVSYVLTAAEGYNLSDYAITYQVGAQGEVKTFDDTYTIPGIEITDNITIVVNADEPGSDTPTIPDTHWGITFEGNAVEDIVKTDGKLPTSVEKNGSFSFTINNADDYTYVVSYKMGEDGDYLDLVNGAYTISPVTNTLVITVNKWKVEVNQYVTLDGKDLFLVAVDETVAEGSGMRYGEDNMYLKSVNDKAEDGKYTGEAHQKYVYLVEVTANETLTVADAAKQLNVMANVNCPEIAVDYNVNGSSTRDINDAQLVYDMYNNVYQNMTTVGMVKFLRADLNGDRTIGVADAATVINDILTNS